jgi:predicted nucleotidyltransferase
MVVSVEQTVATLRARAAAQHAAQQTRARAVRDLLVRAVGAHAPPGAKVWLIGSLAWGGFGAHSDIDLVVQDVPAHLATRLEVDLLRAVALPVDVMRFEDLSASFRARVVQEGVVLHGT